MLGFLDLPPEIRLMVYKYLPTPDNGLDPYHYHYPSHDKRQSSLNANVNLLYTNSTVYREYRAMFYAGIQFDFYKHSSDVISKFLCQIGQHNAQHIRFIHLEFPFWEFEAYRLFAEDETDPTLDMIQRDCTSLETIVFDFTRDAGLTLSELNEFRYIYRRYFHEFLAVLDKRLRAIPSLKSIRVEYPGKFWQWGFILEAMADLNWEFQRE